MGPVRSGAYPTPVEPEERGRQKLACAELQRSVVLGSCFAQAPEAAAVLRMDGIVVSINNEFTRMFGYDEQEILERPIDDLIVPESLKENARDYADKLRHGGRVEVETVRRRKDGSEVRVSILAVPITSDAGEQIAKYAIYRDITEQKRL